MTNTHRHFLVFVMTLGVFGVPIDADTRTFPLKAQLNVGTPEEMVMSTNERVSKLNVGIPKGIGSSSYLARYKFPIAKMLKSTGAEVSDLNVIAPEEIVSMADSIGTYHDKETTNEESADNRHGDTVLNLGVPGGIEAGNLFGGDIILTPEQTEAWNTRKAVRFSWNFWPRREGYPTVHYSIGNTKVSKSMIQEAMTHYEEHTCIRFKQTWWLFHLGPRIVFKDGGGCSSMVGKQFLNILKGQDLILAVECSQLPTVVHEIGHAVGLYHEQSRSDRDEFIKVIPSNIKRGMDYNFNKQATEMYGTTYDYFSVMQYGPLSFSSNGDTTLSATDVMAHGLMIISRSGLSFMDKMILNRMYGCVDQWVSQCSGINSNPCQNMGYLGPDCECICSPGTSGENCQIKTNSYTDALISELLPLSERVTNPSLISSPKYPDPQLPATVFTKMIEAPTCKIVKLTVIGFNMFQRYSSKRCSSEGVEIRLADPVTSGKWYCGSELKPGDTLQSEGNTLVLFYIKARMKSNINRGFSFDVTFQNDPSCQ